MQYLPLIFSLLSLIVACLALANSRQTFNFTREQTDAARKTYLLLVDGKIVPTNKEAQIHSAEIVLGSIFFKSPILLTDNRFPAEVILAIVKPLVDRRNAAKNTLNGCIFMIPCAIHYVSVFKAEARSVSQIYNIHCHGEYVQGEWKYSIAEIRPIGEMKVLKDEQLLIDQMTATSDFYFSNVTFDGSIPKL